MEGLLVDLPVFVNTSAPGAARSEEASCGSVAGLTEPVRRCGGTTASAASEVCPSEKWTGTTESLGKCTYGAKCRVRVKMKRGNAVNFFRRCLN